MDLSSYPAERFGAIGVNFQSRSWPGAVLLALLGLFLVFEVFSGPLRFVLSQHGFVGLVYLPKALLLLSLLVVPLTREKASRQFIIISLALAAYLGWGIVQLHSLEQALFGLWVMAPLLFGLLAGPVLWREPLRLHRFFLALFWIAWLGLVLNLLIGYRWVGSGYQLDGATIEASRQWSTLGLSRLPGFSRASFAVASQLLMFGIFLFFTLGSRRWRNLIWLAAGAGIILTTSKGPMATWLLVTLYLLTRSLGYWRVWNAALFAVGGVMVVVPLTTLVIQYSPEFSNHVNTLLFASFGERLNWMWPDSFALIHQPLQWLFGRGLGGIGAPQQYFEPDLYKAADNLFVYLCVDFGLVGALGFLGASLVAALRHHKKTLLPQSGLGFAIILACLAYGIVVNVMEGATLSLFLGMAITASASYGGFLRLRGGETQ